MKRTARSRARRALAVIAVVAAMVAPTSEATAEVGVRPASSGCSLICTTGYYLAGADGGVFAFGDAPFFGSMAGKALAAPVVDIASLVDLQGETPAEVVQPRGYYLAAADGGVFAFGDAPFFGSMAGTVLSAPIVGIVASPSAEGYWLLGADGAIYAFGDAEPPFPPPTPLQAPVVDFDLTWTGAVPSICMVGPPLAAGRGDAGRAGYDEFSWGTLAVNATGDRLLASDPENSFEIEREPRLPSPLVAPIVAVATSDPSRYWLAAADGGVFTSYCMPFYGSMGGKALAAPVVDMDSTTNGYLLAAADGGVFAFGDAPFSGSMAGKALAAPVVGIATTLGA